MGLCTNGGDIDLADRLICALDDGRPVVFSIARLGSDSCNVDFANWLISALHNFRAIALRGLRAGGFVFPCGKLGHVDLGGSVGGSDLLQLRSGHLRGISTPAICIFVALWRRRTRAAQWVEPRVSASDGRGCKDRLLRGNGRWAA